MLKLVQTDWGQFDLDVIDAADDTAQAEAETIIYAALCTDAEAPARRVPDAYDRRGWWADPPAGSGIWYLRRQPLTDTARREGIDMVETALKARAPGLVTESVEVAPGISPAGTVSSLVLAIAGTYADRKVLIQIPL